MTSGWFNSPFPLALHFNFAGVAVKVSVKRWVLLIFQQCSNLLQPGLRRYDLTLLHGMDELLDEFYMVRLVRFPLSNSSLMRFSVVELIQFTYFQQNLHAPSFYQLRWANLLLLLVTRSLPLHPSKGWSAAHQNCTFSWDGPCSGAPPTHTLNRFWETIQ